jgi:trimeric autotransporter adhesin
MTTLKQIYFASVLLLALLTTATAQESTSTAAQRSALTITANATGERVRITAPSSVVQLHLEVYGAGGEKVFDQEIRGGNVFDWHLQDGQGRRLAPGAYVCVVTAKSVSGKLTQKIGTVRVEEKSAGVQPAESQQLSPPQAQAIGPVEENSSWTIPGTDEPQTTTVIAHDGTDGQMIRGRGALSFRVGNFFSGIDQEQMRLTETGNLGIGTAQPQARLDVAGTIRAERFLIAKPMLANGDKTADAQVADSGDAVQPLASGSGTQNRIAKWIDGAGTLGDSGITETVAGNIGIGTASPNTKLEVVGSQLPNLNDVAWFSGGAAANATGPRIVLSQSFGGNYTNWRGAEISAMYQSAAGTYAHDLIFGTNSGGSVSNTTEKMRVTAFGNVGIGTTSPGARLEIKSTNNASQLNSLLINTSGGSTGTGNGIQFQQGGAGVGGIRSVYDGGNLASLRFDVFSAGLSQDKLVILGNGNVGIGATNPVKRLDVAGDINTSSDYNIGGSRVLSVTGTNNLFAGVNAGQANAGGQNTFVGRGAGFSNITGNNDSFFGSQAGNNNGNGSQNSIFGSQAGFEGTTGDYCSLFGYQAGYSNRGNFNSFFGGAAGANNLAGTENSFFGYSTGFHNTTGGSNAFFGELSGISNLDGNSNSFFGDRAGLSNSSGNNNTIIGADADVASANLNHATAIGAEAVISTSNSIGLGRSDGSDTVYVWGVLRTGLDGSGSLDVCRNDAFRLSTCSSSLRYKTRVQPFTRGLDVVRRLRPITFEWKDGVGSDVGFGAEDVEQVEPLLTTRNDKGEIEGVKYKQITTVLVNAIKEQQDQIAALRTANNALNARLRHIEGTLRKKRGSKTSSRL